VAEEESTPEVTKRRVTMTNVTALGDDDKGNPRYARQVVTDYVRPDFLDAYVADAKTRWQLVEVSDEPDAGPGGYHGQTAVPRGLAHPLAGQVFPADDPPKPKRGGSDKTGGVSTFLATQGMIMLAGLAMSALVQTVTQKNTLATAYGNAATHAALYSTVPGASAGTELTGGSPAYARMALTWSAASNGVITVTVTFNVASGSTVAGAGVHTALTAGTYLDGAAVTSQAFASQGTYALTLTYTQT
jgi:hypothetical protein